MTTIEILAIERACERLILAAAEFSDSQKYEALAMLFAEDATLSRPSGDPIVGRAAILKTYQSRPAGRITRHICSNIRIDVESAEIARGKTYAVVYSADAAAPSEAHFGLKADSRRLVGEFEDEFALTPDGWRFSRRIARFVMHTS